MDIGMKFKVGDRVKVIEKGISDASKRHFGQIGIVEVKPRGEEPDETSCNLDLEGKSTGGFYNYELELYNDWDK